jgi:hypothetical protein
MVKIGADNVYNFQCDLEYVPLVMKRAIDRQANDVYRVQNNKTRPTGKAGTDKINIPRLGP